MILRRLGNKKKLAKQIQAHFPAHKIYIEPFFGAGGMFFNKPKAKYNIVNDLDSDVFNLFQVVMNQKDELGKAFYMMPIHSDLLNYWKKNQETDPIKKALRFLFLTNLTYLGKHTNLRYGARNDKNSVLLNIDKTFELLQGVQFNNCDFVRLFESINFIDNENPDCFAYLDPPYLGTDNNYENSFSEDQAAGLFDIVQKLNIKFAYSEFNHPFILEQAKERGLNVIIIGERQNLKNRRTEILVTNYQNLQGKLFN